jgi:hypothetical protein
LRDDKIILFGCYEKSEGVIVKSEGGNLTLGTPDPLFGYDQRKYSYPCRESQLLPVI